MKTLLLITLLCLTANASERIDGIEFVTRAEYHNLKKPCACPSDFAKNGTVCGRRSAFCKTGGYNISDCGKDAVKSIAEYRHAQKVLCGH